MAIQYELTADLRNNLGRGASRRLRRSEKVPAIIYGAEQAPLALSLSHKDLAKALENEAFYSHILTLSVNGEKQQAILKDLQRHPYKPKILHADFYRIDPKEKIAMHVPLHFTGGDAAPGVKDGGVVMHLLTSVEIRCLPGDLPEYINVDISQLVLDHTLHLTDLQLPKGVELMAFTHGHAEEHNAAVVKIHIPRVSTEEETTTVPTTETTTAPTAAANAAHEAPKK